MILSILLSFLVSFPVFAISSVEKIDTSFDEDNFVTELEFGSPIKHEALTVDFINETVQINVPGATVKNGKILNRIRKSGIKSVYTYQFQPDLMRVRIIYDGIKASDYKDRVQLQSAGRVLRIVTAAIPQPKRVAKQAPVSSKKKVTLLPKAKPVSAAVATEKNLKLSAEKILEEELKFAAKAPKVEPAKKVVPPPVSTAELSEEQIPLNLGAKQSKTIEKSSSKTIFYSLLILLAIAIAGFVYLKFYQNQGKIKNNHTSIKMLTQHHLGPKKSLAIVQVAGESILIGVTEQNISHIKTLSLLEEEVPEVTDQPFEAFVEEEPPAAAPQMKTGLYQRTGMPAKFEEEPEDDFTVNSVKNLIKDKVKGLRELR